MLKNDQSGALEQVAKNFATWSQRVARAVTLHKNDADTQEARRRSGSSSGKHGLSAEEEKNRKDLLAEWRRRGNSTSTSAAAKAKAKAEAEAAKTVETVETEDTVETRRSVQWAENNLR